MLHLQKLSVLASEFALIFLRIIKKFQTDIASSILC